MIKYFRLIRWQNLMIIIATMFLVRYFLIMPSLALENIELQMSLGWFIVLVLSVITIAAGGYVINDYFDIRIDRVNAPNKMILGKKMPVRSAIPIHAVLSIVGVILGIAVSFAVGNIKLISVHLLAGFLLWLYSARYKRKPFSGNLIVAFETALVILIVWLFEFFAMVDNTVVMFNRSEWIWLNRIIFFVAGFAFLISLIREMIKDIEDIEGDKRYGCKTLPVVIGTKAVKWISISTMAALMIILVFVQYYLISINFNLTGYYFFIIQFLIGYFIYFLFKAKEKTDYSELGQMALIIMIAGILSMQVYYIDY